MPQIINTNLASINAQRNLDKSQSASQTAMQRLSSGLRINSAKDDAAGMAISTRFTSQIKGLNVAVRNAGDGIALAQTAEGALGSMNDNLQRIRELAVQSANATNSDVDREALQAEVKQLVAEITRTADETDFNGRKLLDGSFKATFQVGANAGQTLDISIAELTADKLGASATAGVSALGTDKKLSNGDLVINGENIRASVSKDDAVSAFDRDKSAIAKAAAINASSAKSGVTATVNENVHVGGSVTGPATTAQTVFVNGVSISLQGTANGTDVDRAGTRNAVVAAINAKSGQTGVIAEDGGDQGGVVLKAADGRNITLSSDAAGTTGMNLTAFGLGDTTGKETTYAGYTLNSANASTPIVVQGGNNTGDGDIRNSGLAAGTYTAQVATVVSKAASSAANTALGYDTATSASARKLEAGDIVINGVSIGSSTAMDDTSSSKDQASSAIAMAAAINRSSDATGVKATVNANEVVGAVGTITAAGAVNLAITINGVAINAANTSKADTNLTAAMDAINQESGRTGVRAENNGKSLTLIADDGRNIDISSVTGGAGFGLNNVSVNNTYYGTFTLTSSSAIDISYGKGSKTELENSGLAAGKFGGGEDGQALTDIDISTFEGAQKAMVAIDNAIGQVASQRADLGAVQNRMSSTVENLKVTSENLSSANSRILDADFAAETAEMSRTQILQQAGISILAQANASGQNVLSLLG
ncbi:MAG: flagellin [Venatoribacter sp.]